MFLSLIPNNADRVTMTLTSPTKQCHLTVYSHIMILTLKEKKKEKKLNQVELFYDGAVKTLGCAFLL